MMLHRRAVVRHFSISAFVPENSFHDISVLSSVAFYLNKSGSHIATLGMVEK